MEERNADRLKLSDPLTLKHIPRKSVLRRDDFLDLRQMRNLLKASRSSRNRAGLLEGGRQFFLLSLRQFDLLRANVIVHLLERLQALHLAAEEAVHFFQGGLAQCRRSVLDVCGLSDVIQPSDALCKQFRIQRQVKQDQMTGEPGVSSFAADLRTDQQPHSAGSREPRGVAIPLHQREAFVQTPRFDGEATS